MFVEDFSTPETEIGVEDEVVKTLRRAAERCRIYGWQQGEFGFIPNGPRCAWGHMFDAERELYPDENRNITYDAWQAMRDLVGEPPAQWNDKRGRTASEVIAALEGAASSRLAALQGKG